MLRAAEPLGPSSKPARLQEVLETRVDNLLPMWLPPRHELWKTLTKGR